MPKCLTKCFANNTFIKITAVEFVTLESFLFAELHKIFQLVFALKYF